ncbi:caspase domain-containing protein [Streptomyces sp. NBC_00658]|uniref:caspase family protein n=1 Tax=Streptomyces sp. NBC_00658 TaxID=2975800 RepID=UPI003245AB0B
MSRIPDAGASCAVLIGASRYTHLESLPAVANNLTALAQELSGPLSWGLSDGRCIVVAEPVSAPQVLDVVESAAAMATDTLLVYYAGHGLQTEDGELYLSVSGSVPQRADTGLQYAHLRQMLLRSQAERHVVVLDCCFSGKALGVMSGSDGLVEHAEIEGSYVITASPGYKQALAPPGDTYTAFTGELLNVLRVGIPGGSVLLDFDAVYGHVRRVLTAKGRPAPQKRGGNTAGQLVFCRNRSHQTVPTRGESAVEQSSGGRAWPDPTQLRTAAGFIRALNQVRITSGLGHKGISEHSGRQIAPGTVSSLLNRKTLPGRWNTTHVFLSACGVPVDQIVGWKEVWERLRAEQRDAAASGAQQEEVPQPTAAARPTIWRRLGRQVRRGGEK